MKKIKNSISALSSVPVYAEQFNELIDELGGTITPSVITTSWLTVNGQGDFSTLTSDVVATSYINEKVTGNGVTIDGVVLKDGMVTMATQILPATGSTIDDAAQITGQMVVVTLANGTKGVLLPFLMNADNNKVIFLINTANAVLKIYPRDGQSIQGGTASTPISLAAYGVAIFTFKASGDWYAAEITGGAVS